MISTAVRQAISIRTKARVVWTAPASFGSLLPPLAPAQPRDVAPSQTLCAAEKPATFSGRTPLHHIERA